MTNACILSVRYEVCMLIHTFMCLHKNVQILGIYRKSDTGVYTCRARNQDGESTWTASLLVEGKFLFI